MVLNSRQSSFLVTFPQTFFCKDVETKYAKYFQSLILPYKNIADLMESTIQSIDFPELDMKPVSQVRPGGKLQEFKNSKPIQELFSREFTITFKLTDAFLNYFIFLDNALNYYDFDNVEPTYHGKTLGEPKIRPKKDWDGQYFDPIRLTMLSNEGYAVVSVVFDKPLLKGWSGLKLNYSSNHPDFNTFAVKFNFFQMSIVPDFK